jgi:hypothetical protein
MSAEAKIFARCFNGARNQLNKALSLKELDKATKKGLEKVLKKLVHLEAWRYFPEPIVEPPKPTPTPSPVVELPKPVQD